MIPNFFTPANLLDWIIKPTIINFLSKLLVSNYFFIIILLVSFVSFSVI